jgi:hypothetical protein
MVSSQMIEHWSVKQSFSVPFSRHLGDWPAQLGRLLKETGKKPTLDVVVDSAGGDIIGQCGRMLTSGARVVCYGM